MLEFRSGSSNSVKGAKALRESLELARERSTAEPGLLIVHATMGHDLERLLRSATEACPRARVVGCTGSGVIAREGVSEKMRALAIMTVTGDEVAVAATRGVTGASSQDAARSCAQALAAEQDGINMVQVLGP